jgi:hypothetical protein
MYFAVMPARILAARFAQAVCSSEPNRTIGWLANPPVLKAASMSAAWAQ